MHGLSAPSLTGDGRAVDGAFAPAEVLAPDALQRLIEEARAQAGLGRWTDGRTRAVVALWRDGWSAQAVASRLGGVSRNAVIGKVHRLGLKGRETLGRPMTVRLQPKSKRVRAPRAARPSTAATTPASQSIDRARILALQPAPVDGALVGVLALRAGQCRFPIGAPATAAFAFCARAVRDAECPYCADHAQLCYTPRKGPKAGAA